MLRVIEDKVGFLYTMRSDDIKGAFLKWEMDYRMNKTLSKEESMALSAEDVATRAMHAFLDYLEE